jgi:hypothetical protein
MKFATKALSVSAFALAVFASSTLAPMFASSLSGPKANEPAFNPATMVELQGSITAVRQVPAGSPLEGLHLTVKSKTSTVDVYLAPNDFLKIFKTNFPVGANVRVVGSKVNFANADVILSNEVDIGITEIILRDGSGAPVWQNWGVEL